MKKLFILLVASGFLANNSWAINGIQTETIILMNSLTGESTFASGTDTQKPYCSGRRVLGCLLNAGWTVKSIASGSLMSQREGSLILVLKAPQ